MQPKSFLQTSAVFMWNNNQIIAVSEPDGEANMFITLCITTLTTI